MRIRGAVAATALAGIAVAGLAGGAPADDPPTEDAEAGSPPGATTASVRTGPTQEEPAEVRAGAVDARRDRVRVTTGSTVRVRVLANDQVARKRLARVSVVSSSSGLRARVSRQKVVITAVGRTSGRVVYRVTDYRGRTDRARVRVRVTAAPAPSPSPGPTSGPTPTPAPTPTPSPTPAPVPANGLAAAVSRLTVAPEGSAYPYDRALFPHWNSGLFADGCDTRSEVLKAEAVVPVASGTSCPVTTSRSGGGQWYSYYDGVTTTDPSGFDIDHLVPLGEAHASGAWAWDVTRKEAFANDQGDPRSLVAVTANANRGKGDQDPAEWQPLRERCRYLSEWVAVKLRWQLTIDPAEKDSLLLGAQGCPDTTVTVIPLAR